MYFKAVIPSGHFGAGNDTADLVFYIQATDAIKAMDTAKKFPAVKHHRTPLVYRIDFEEFNKHKGESAYDKRDRKN